MTDLTIYTPSNIFSGIDFGLDTETSVIKEYTREGIQFKEFYFSARQVNAKRPRGYGVVACRAENPSAPLLVITGDVNHGIDTDIMSSYVKENFSVLMYDYSGEDGKKAKFTFYPPETDYANYIRANRHFKYADDTARETCYFEWAALSHYAVTAALKVLGGQDIKVGLLGIGTGADIVWMLSSFDKRVSAACAVFSAGWGGYEGIYKYGGGNALINIDEEREKWLAGISAESYAKFITLPMLYISSSNNKITHMERAYDTLSRIPENVYTLACISPRLSNAVGFKSTRDISLFFKKFLSDEDITLPGKISCGIETSGGKTAVNVLADKSCGISQITVYYSEGEINPCARNWYEIDIDVNSEQFTAYPKICCALNYLFAYANVTYKSGLTVSSNLCAKKVSETDSGLPPFRRSPLIYNSVMGKDCFTLFSPENLKLSDIFLDENSITMVEGPGGINGVSAKSGRLATYKTGSAGFKGSGEESFKFDVYSPQPQELTLYFLDRAGRSDEHYHTCKIKLMGGSIWQPVEVKKQNLKTSEGQILKSWEDISLAGFEAADMFAVNNLLWI